MALLSLILKGYAFLLVQFRILLIFHVKEIIFSRVGSGKL